MKLNETNYAHWAVIMKAILVRKGLWGVVSEDEPRPLGSENSKAVKAWKRKMEEAHSEIVLNVEPTSPSSSRSRHPPLPTTRIFPDDEDA